MPHTLFPFWQWSVGLHLAVLHNYVHWSSCWQWLLNHYSYKPWGSEYEFIYNWMNWHIMPKLRGYLAAQKAHTVEAHYFTHFRGQSTMQYTSGHLAIRIYHWSSSYTDRTRQYCTRQFQNSSMTPCTTTWNLASLLHWTQLHTHTPPQLYHQHAWPGSVVALHTSSYHKSYIYQLMHVLIICWHNCRHF